MAQYVMIRWLHEFTWCKKKIGTMWMLFFFGWTLYSFSQGAGSFEWMPPANPGTTLPAFKCFWKWPVMWKFVWNHIINPMVSFGKDRLLGTAIGRKCTWIVYSFFIFLPNLKHEKKTSPNHTSTYNYLNLNLPTGTPAAGPRLGLDCVRGARSFRELGRQRMEVTPGRATDLCPVRRLHLWNFCGGFFVCVCETHCWRNLEIHQLSEYHSKWQFVNYKKKLNKLRKTLKS